MNLATTRTFRDDAAERAILGAVLLDGEGAIPAILETGLERSDFYAEAHRLIWTAALDVWQEGAAPDFVTVLRTLRDMGVLEQAGGGAYLSELSTSQTVISNAAHYCGIVRRMAKARAYQTHALQLLSALNDEANDLDEIEAAAVTASVAIQESSTDADDNRPRPVLEVVTEEIDAQGSETPRESWPSFLPDVTDKAGGYRPGQLVVIAARPGMGKSAYALHLALSLGSHTPKGHSAPLGALFCSLEMSNEETARRVIAITTRQPVAAWNDGRVIPDAVESARVKTYSRLKDSAVHLWDCPGASVDQICAKIRAMVARYGVRAVIVDYLQIMSASADVRRQSREVQVADMARKLKACAGRTNTVIFALSQLNREVEKRGDKRPIMADLRESGAIEQDANRIEFLHRPGYYEQRPLDPAMEVVIGKNRGGGCGIVNALFDPPTLQISSLPKATFSNRPEPEGPWH